MSEVQLHSVGGGKESGNPRHLGKRELALHNFFDLLESLVLLDEEPMQQVLVVEPKTHVFGVGCKHDELLGRHLSCFDLDGRDRQHEGFWRRGFGLFAGTKAEGNSKTTAGRLKGTAT